MFLKECADSRECTLILKRFAAEVVERENNLCKCHRLEMFGKGWGGCAFLSSALAKGYTGKLESCCTWKLLVLHSFSKH